MKKLIAILIAIAMIVVGCVIITHISDEVSADTVYTDGDWDYVLDSNSNAVLTGYHGTGVTSLVIPPTVELDLPHYDTPITVIVAGIGDYTGSGTYAVTNSNLSSNGCTLTFPSTITTIYSNAFKNCTYLKGTLTLPSNINYIASSAFYGCTGFTGSLTLPNTLTTIGSSAFRGCTGFTGTLTLSTNLTYIGQIAFSGCTGFTGNLVIPDSVTTVERRAFEGCTGFNGTLAISDSLTTIEDLTFKNCAFTGNLIIPTGVTSIGQSAFEGCIGFIGELNLPNTLTIIVRSAFEGCTGFTGDLILPDSITTIGDRAFYGCTGMTGELHLPESLTSIADSVFLGSNLTGDLVIPDNVTSIGQSAFSNCDGFTGDLVIPDNVTSIGQSAFANCTGLNGTLTLSASLTAIGASAFSSCANLTGDLVIPDNVTSIGQSAFLMCRGLHGALSIPDSVTQIANNTFNGAGFTDIHLSKTLTTIGDTAFINVEVTHIVIPNSVTTIGQQAFKSCTSMQYVIVGNSVSSIGTDAFDNTPLLKTVYNASSLNIVAGANTYGEVAENADYVYATSTVTLQSNNTDYGTVDSSYVYIITGMSLTISGNILTTPILDQSVTATANPHDGDDYYRFVQWDNISGPVSADRTVTAMFEIIPWRTVSIVSNDESLGTVDVDSVSVLDGTVPTAQGNILTIGEDTVTATPVADTVSTHFWFSQWQTLAPIVSDATITAVFDSGVRAYTVSFETNGRYGNVDYANLNVDYGTSITVSDNTVTIGETTVTATPIPSTLQYEYAFDSWRGITPTVESDMTLTANFVRTAHPYTITFIVNKPAYGEWNVNTLTIPYGTAVTKSGNTLDFNGVKAKVVLTSSTPMHTYRVADILNVPTVVSGDTTITANLVRDNTMDAFNIIQPEQSLDETTRMKEGPAWSLVLVIPIMVIVSLIIYAVKFGRHDDYNDF